jgi:ferric-dicitrate binding protein FerR (iron transport regulator)
MKSNHDMDELIASYLTEGLDTTQWNDLNKWIQASDEHGKYFRDMREIWFSSISASDTKRFNKAKAYKHFLACTGKSEKKKNFLLGRPFRYAAAVAVLLIIVSYASYQMGGEVIKNQFSEVVIEAPLGSRSKTFLPDGTLVWLNAGSKITYSQGFGVNERKIQLSGEGYFEVTKNEKLPFNVQTKELGVNVLGTKFNFRNYEEDEEATVSLLEGKVSATNLIKENKTVQLAPDQIIFLNKKNGNMRITTVLAQNTAEWTKGYLFFDEELLPDIVKELERSYGVTIHITDPSLNAYRFYGSFVRREQTIEEVLELLASTHKLIYDKHGNEIVLSSIH